jgi:hypothetical protein
MLLRHKAISTNLVPQKKPGNEVEILAKLLGFLNTIKAHALYGIPRYNNDRNFRENVSKFL